MKDRKIHDLQPERVPEASLPPRLEQVEEHALRRVAQRSSETARAIRPIPVGAAIERPPASATLSARPIAPLSRAPALPKPPAPVRSLVLAAPPTQLPTTKEAAQRAEPSSRPPAAVAAPGVAAPAPGPASREARVPEPGSAPSDAGPPPGAAADPQLPASLHWTVADVLRARRGRQLDPATRGWFEQRFPFPFGRVRVHDDAAADQSARAVGALAYTVGEDLIFRAGAFRPDTLAGRRLLAHELAHVIQQAGGAGATPPSRSLEADADAAAAIAASGGRVARLGLARRGEVQRQTPETATGDVRDTRQIAVNFEFRGAAVNAMVTPDDTSFAFFEAQSDLATSFAQDVARVVLLPQPVHETPRFLTGATIGSLLASDLPDWLATRTLPRFRAFIAARQAALVNQHLRAGIEASLQGSGIDPPAIDWNAELPRLQGAAPIEPVTMADYSHLDRYALFLELLAVEVSADGPVEGARPLPATAPRLILLYAVALPRTAFGADVPRLYSEAFLEDYAAQLRALRYLPDGFDADRFRPFPADQVDAERDRLTADFVENYAPQRMAILILDQWTVSAQNEETFLAQLDVDAMRERLLDSLAEDFMRFASRDPTWVRALQSAAADQARYQVILRIATLAQLAQNANAAMEADFLQRPLDELTQDEIAVGNDPAGFLETAQAVSTATLRLLQRATPGAPLDLDLADWGESIAQAVHVPARFGRAAGLLELFQGLLALRDLAAQQRTEARRRIRERLDLSFDRIAYVVRLNALVAHVFIHSYWIPMLRQVAVARITANHQAMVDWLADFDHHTNQEAARYRVTAMVLQEIRDRLASGEAESVSVGEGDSQRMLTIADVPDLDSTIGTFNGLAAQLTDPAGRERKRGELRDSVAAFAEVKRKIEDGTYDPLDYGRAVYEEARQRLGISSFPDHTTYLMVLSREVNAAQNPFLAHAIVEWQFRETTSREMNSVLKLVGLGLITIGASLIPFVGPYIAAAIDIGFAGYGVLEARDVLIAAEQDTDLSVWGVSVEQARRGLRNAVIMLAVTVILHVGPSALRGLLRFIGRLRREVQLINFTRALALDAERTEALLLRVRGMGGDSAALDGLLGHVGLDFTRLESLLSYTEDLGLLSRTLQRVDAETLEAMLIASRSGGGGLAEVVPLLDRVRNPVLLRWLLENVESAAQLTRFLGKARNAGEVAELLRSLTAAELAPMLAKAQRADQLIALLGRVEGAQQLVRFFEKATTAAEVGEMITLMGGAGRLDAVLGQAANLGELRGVLRRGVAADQLVRWGPQMDSLAQLTGALDRHVPIADLDRWLARADRIDPVLGALDRATVADINRLLHGAPAMRFEQLTDMLGRVRNAAQLDRLAGHIPDPAMLQRLLQGPWLGAGTVEMRAAELEALIQRQGAAEVIARAADVEAASALRNTRAAGAIDIVAQDAAGGHTIFRHGPSVTDAYLQGRVAGGIPVATRFTNVAEMNAAVNEAYAANRVGIDAFYANPANANAPHPPIRLDTGRPVGEGFYRPPGTAAVAPIPDPVTQVQLFFRGDGHGGYRLVSAHPYWRP